MVFFFKQKTAYEMRISDWSSDVCSSDLCRCASGSLRGRGAKIAGRFVDHRGLRPTQRMRPVLAAVEADGGHPLVDQSGILASAQEIGRASCRERVCQYV